MRDGRSRRKEYLFDEDKNRKIKIRNLKGESGTNLRDFTFNKGFAITQEDPNVNQESLASYFLERKL